MKLTDLLTEGLSPILYHMTIIDSAVKILAQDTMSLRPAMVDNIENKLRFKDKPYYFSTARTSNNFLFKDMIQDDDHMVILVLDGVAMERDGLIGKSVDWAYHARKGVSNDRKFSETEDRIFSNKPAIKGFTKYITEVRVLYHSEMPASLQPQSYYKVIANVCERKDIPLTYYDSEKAFLLGDRRKSIKVELSGKYNINPIDVHTDDLMIPEDFKEHAKLLFTVMKSDDIPETTTRFFSDFGFRSQLFTDIFNTISNYSEHPLVQRVSEVITTYMKKNNLRTMSDFTDYITDKVLS